MTRDEQMAAFKAKKAERDEAKHRFDQLDAELKAMNTELYDRMREEHVKETRIEGVGKFVRKDPTWYAQVQDRAAFQRWAEVNRPGLIKMQEEKKLLNEMVRELIRDQKELPPGIGAYPDEKVAVYK